MVKKRRRPKAQTNRIKGLTSYTRKSDDVVIWRWVPSPKYRKIGFVAINLGEDRGAAVNAAEEWNKQASAAATPIPGMVAPRAPRHATFGDLVHRFRQHMDERAALPRGHEDHLTPKTCAQYRSQLKWLMAWSEGGTELLSLIGEEECKDLRKTLVNSASSFNCAARLRMLRQLLGFAVGLKWIKVNPMAGKDITIPTPKSRTKRATIEAVEYLAEFARTYVGEDNKGVPRYGGVNLELAVLLGFYTTQREGDLLAATRMCWRPIEDVDDYDRAVLAPDGNGALFGLRIFQQKTQKWVTCFLPPDVAAKLDALIDSRGPGWDGPLLQADRANEEKQWHEQAFQRTYRAMRNAALEAARGSGDAALVAELENLRYGDMRRSGMCWLRDTGTTPAQIAIISGHSIDYTLKILDTYMPGDARGSAAGMANALRTRAKAKARKKG